ncbi:MAG: hypothetical protein UY41_C0012G0005 [Candidatus Moranbacteria bacterium GW2011_GWE1_49_15]
MHDFLLAKEIVDEVLKIVEEKKLSKVSKVKVELGQIALAHDGHDEHVEDISIENLMFGIEGVSKNTVLKNTEFDIEKVEGEHWKIVSMEAE